MLFVLVGLLKPEIHSIPQEVQQQVNEFLGQPYVDIRSAGALRDASGERAGMMIMVDCPDREHAESFLATSPYLGAGLYAEANVFQYASEVGAL